MSFQILSSDVSYLPQAPDLTFTVSEDRLHIVATHEDRWTISISLLEEGRSLVSIELDGAPYCRAIHIPTESLHFCEENAASEVACFAASLFWSAWRRMTIARLEGES